MGLLLRGWRGKREGKWWEREEKGEVTAGAEREGKGPAPPPKYFGLEQPLSDIASTLTGRQLTEWQSAAGPRSYTGGRLNDQHSTLQTAARGRFVLTDGETHRSLTRCH